MAAMTKPGSDAAKDAFYSACHEHGIRTLKLSEGYKDLSRSDGKRWDAASLCRAMEAREITPAECARLYPRATELSLGLDMIAHELNLGALFALAFANEYGEG